MEQWPNIDFIDDPDGCLFTATIHRKISSDGSSEEIKSSQESSQKSSQKTEIQILELIQQDSLITTDQLGKLIGITRRAVLKQINKLKEQGRVRRVGPDKGGHWEVLK